MMANASVDRLIFIPELARIHTHNNENILTEMKPIDFLAFFLAIAG